MKKIIIYIALLLLGSITFSCTEEKLIDNVFSDVGRGLVLRTIATPNPTFDFFDTSASWKVTLEAQDAEGGKLFSEIKVYVTFINDGTASTEALATTVPASSFSPGPLGYPRGDVALTLGETLTALGLQSGDYDSADSFNIRLVGVLSDGRQFTNNANGTVTGGSFFRSPFAYSAQFFCPLADASLFDGNYIVTADAWADYAIGAVVPVAFDTGYKFRILSTNNPFINNTATAYMEVTIDPADGTVTVVSNEDFDYGVPVPVTGTGSVGTCTGDINLNLNFVGQATNQAFSLVKQ